MRVQMFMAAVSLVVATRAGATQQCGGVERWAVKVAADQGAASIKATPLPTAFSDLVQIPRPTVPSDEITRSPAEQEVRVIDGRLVRFKLESGKTGDHDFHLVVTDDTQVFTPTEGPASPHSVIAEIVDPACIGGRNGSVTAPSRFATQLTAARTRFQQQFPHPHSGWNDGGGIRVRVTGVVFFDRPHRQVGRSLQGLELHPVLDIQFDPSTPPPPPTPITVASVAASVALANPGFELGAAGWTASPDVIREANDEQPRSGDWMAWLGGYGTAHVDQLSQEVTLPASATAISLSFFLHVSTEEVPTGVADRLRVRIRGPNGGLISTLEILSNLDAADGFQQHTFDLSQFRGRTIRISLEAVENSSNLTSFFVDDFSLVIQP